MAFYKNYSPGEAFEHTAARENDISRLLNMTQGGGLGKIAGKTPGTVRLPCYNSTAAAIKAGTAVAFDDEKPMCDDAVPVKLFSDAGKQWGVLESDLAANELGNVIVSGPAKVTVSGSTGDSAAPSTTDPATFVRGSSGSPVLFASETTALILLGGTTVATYTGYFKVVDASTKEGEAMTRKVKVVDGAYPSASTCGHATFGETHFEVAAQEITVAASGFLFIRSALGAGSAPLPQAPVFEFLTAWPGATDGVGRRLIATVIVGGTTMDIHQQQHGEVQAIIWGRC